MALTRTGLMTAIENSTDATELQNLNLQLQAVNTEISILNRGISQIIQIISQIDGITNPAQAILDCKSALQTEMINYQNQLLAYSA